MSRSESSRPILTSSINMRDSWRYLVVTLSADERRALVALANVQRRHPAETASLLIRLALEEKGLMEPEVWE